MLRIEAIAHNTRELKCRRSVEDFPEVVLRLKSMLERFADALSCIDQCFIADDMLEDLPAASRIGKTIVGGIDLNKARMRAVLEALIALSASPMASPPPTWRLGFAHAPSKAHHSMVPATPLMI